MFLLILSLKLNNQPISFHQPLIHLEEAGDAIGFGETFDREAVGGHDGAVVVLMGAAQFGGHKCFVVEVSQGTVGIEGAGVEDGFHPSRSRDHATSRRMPWLLVSVCCPAWFIFIYQRRKDTPFLRYRQVFALYVIKLKIFK